MLVEDVISMDEIDVQCKQETDEDRGVFQQISDQKWNWP